MSKKAILNATSTKKRNTMLSLTNTASSGASQTLAPGGAVVNGNATGRFLFCPTAQDLSSNTGAPNLLINQASRTATTCFIRGFAEHIRIQTSSGLPWFHRRVCFTAKSNVFLVASPSDTPTQTYAPAFETSNGWQRIMFNSTINSQPTTISNIEGVIFRGTQNLDWTDILIAATDPTRISVKFDKTWTIKSGNASGTVAERKLWHPMNHNLVYDDDEGGAGETTSAYSVQSKAGMGDYFIYDIFTPGIGGSSTDQISVTPNSTLYWHEK